VTAPPARVLVAMSGGVDSSVAAALLVEAGHDVTGVTLRLWGGESDSGCCSVGDVEDARRVAAQVGVPHYVFDLSDVFERSVVGPYVRAHAAGRTPNPCVDCNRHIKLGVLLDRADALGFDALATGHHARVERTGGATRLHRGHDAAKDQAYVLAMSTPAQLARLLLPIGDLTKAEVRAHAARLGLRTAEKPESMDVCFITRGGRHAFLDARTPPRPGDVVDADGAVLGRHDGLTHVTIGQRRGLGIGGGARRYVVGMDPVSARVTVGPREALHRDEITIDDVTWVVGPPSPDADVWVQTSAHGRPTRGRVEGATVRLHEPMARVAPGQVVAIFDGDVVVGGAIAA